MKKQIKRKNNPVLDRGEDVVAAMKKLKEKNLKVEDTVNVTTSGLGVTAAVEASTVMTPTTQDEINRLKGELALVSGKSDFANNTRHIIQKKIDRLERNNH